MKKILIALFISFSLTANATTYYLSPNGSDASGKGSASSPWKTLAYACSKATTPGDIIHIKAGTYAETSQSKLAVGVSIEGDGVTSIIKSSVAASGSGAGAWTIQANSAMGTNGNQHISNIMMDGLNLTAWGAIGVNGRSNVKIYNCTIINFLEVAVTFNGAAGYQDGAPGTFGTGNELHDCIVTNCAGYRGSNDYGAGNIMIGGQNGLLIYNNTIVQTARTNNLNGYIIKYYSGGYNKGIKIYNNYLETAPRAGTQATSSWGFVLEQWNPIGGWEIYDNTIKGCLDLVNVSKGSYAFSFDIHDNTLGFNSTPPTGSTQGDVGIRLESYFQGVNIYKNHFKNHVCSVYASGENGPASDGLNMYHNIFENVGGDNNTGWVFRYTNDGSTYNVSNLNFWNNVMIASTAHSTNYGITIPIGTLTNVSIKNNIIVGFSQGPVQKGISGNGTNISIENNIFYKNGNSNAAAGNITYSKYTDKNNLKVDPLFVSSANFHLQSSSPAIGKGINVGLKTDYDGNALKDPPSIGAFENGSAPSAPVVVIPVYQNAVIENATPSLLEMTYNMTLAGIVPAASSFSVLVNSVSRAVNSVVVYSSRVQLTLATTVDYDDVVTVSYTPPQGNPLQTASGGLAAGITAKSVTNNCQSLAKSNTTPFPVIKNVADSYSGLVYEIDASGSYDSDKDILTFEWILPDNVSASSTNSSKIKFLAPVVTASMDIDFLLKVSDGKTVASKIIPIRIMPYKPELYEAIISKIEASAFQTPDYPKNAIDGTPSTKWSANGDNQWLEFTLAKSFKISHLEIAFLPEQRYESYFDIYTSTDNLKWDLILTNAASCNFSGDNQVFDFPVSDINTEYSYIKLVGHGNSLNRWNNYSEIKIIGTSPQNSVSNGPDNRKIILYPNPVQDFFSISVDESAIEPDTFRITDLSGRIFFEGSFYSGIKDVQIPSNLVSGVYLVELMSGATKVDSVKMIIAR